MSQIIDFIADWRFLSIMCAANLFFAVNGHWFNGVVAVITAFCVGHSFGVRK
ncbi:hypothetical protein [uncultured Stenotrophomonas sp.]|uniref:hypothetical protein n=1 Tax=uncultured Stenotrophomonas sp. TaxID=165438 RepID=UPI00258352AE|nr:hypothetical protein [uncultured Stenotrophomonas sp.]